MWVSPAKLRVISIQYHNDIPTSECHVPFYCYIKILLFRGVLPVIHLDRSGWVVKNNRMNTQFIRFLSIGSSCAAIVEIRRVPEFCEPAGT